MAPVCLLSSIACALPVAFPGAEGSGRFAAGGRGGAVYEVTNLNNSGAGSIVDALSQPNRTIVFRVSGTIELNGVMLYPQSNTTIAGQTAPGDGICIKGRFHIRDNVHDIIIRYIRIRVDAGAPNSDGDAIDIDNGYNIIIDHVSASYSRDETISCQEDSDNVTVQWCIMSEALTNENHSYGSLIRGEYGQEKTYHHNLYAHNYSRNPRPGNYTSGGSDPEGLHFDFRNNVVYNWLKTAPGYGDSGSEVSRYNFVGNVYIPGPESTNNGYGFRELSNVCYGYFADNSYNGVVPADPWSIVLFDGLSSSEIDAYKARSYLVPMEPVTTTSPAQAKIDVLANGGASFPIRDAVDTRIIDDVINKTGHSIAYTTDLADPWPTLNSLPAPADTDHDGMPDVWETANGLNDTNPADRNNYDLHAEYTNLEIYLNSLVEGNPPPDVDAGADQVTWLGSRGISGQEVVTLNGTVSDDGPYAVLWTQVDNGAPAVTIDPDDTDDTTVTITEHGVYEFMLTANDGTGQSSDTVEVIVGASACEASHWSTGNAYSLGDINQDCLVNMQDVALFVMTWLNCTNTLISFE
jgi:pectate lyase